MKLLLSGDGAGVVAVVVVVAVAVVAVWCANRCCEEAADWQEHAVIGPFLRRVLLYYGDSDCLLCC